MHRSRIGRGALQPNWEGIFRMTPQHYEQSSFREQLLEHLFVGELLKFSWLQDSCSLEIAKPEVDRAGYDLVAEAHGVIRHIQLKTTYIGARSRQYTVHLALAEKPSGCIIVILFNQATLQLGPYLFFGDEPGKPLPPISQFRVARHTKANAEGFKAERPLHRVVPKSAFSQIDTLEALYARLFGVQQGTAVDT